MRMLTKLFIIGNEQFKLRVTIRQTFKRVNISLNYNQILF